MLVWAEAAEPSGCDEVLIYSEGSQAGSNRTDMYALFAEPVASSVGSFSLVLKDLLDTRRSNPTLTLTPVTPTFAPDEIQALVARGRSYSALLRAHA